MKTLVVYYSRTGITEKIALDIAEKLDAEIEKIVDVEENKGMLGYLSGIRRSMTRKPAQIRKPKKEPKDYDLVIVGTPVWTNTMAPAVRTYLSSAKIKKAAFFCTCRMSGIQHTLTDMLSLVVDAKLVAKMGLNLREVREGSEKVREFVEKVENA